jgi:predicted dehydrogenase
VVIGRGEKSAMIFKDKTGIQPVTGGIDSYINTKNAIPERAVVAVGVDQLFSVTNKLLDCGVKKILVEKPGVLTLQEADELADKARKKNAQVLVAYNRRLYKSVEEAAKIIQSDGGATSFQFEFTERSHIIESLDKPSIVKQNWFLANSTHVVDMAFFLCGIPEEINCHTRGGLSWHTRSSVFAGSGVSKSGALFSYSADWGSAGRWSIEVMTAKRRLIFRPLERLQIQIKGQTETNGIAADYHLDEEFKPGLYRQLKSFLDNDFRKLCTLDEQKYLMPIYNKMAGYDQNE